MTVLANEGAACVARRMRSQQVSRSLMRVSMQVGARQRGRQPLVVGVAVAAIRRGCKAAMKPVLGFDLLRHPGVARQAAIAHSIPSGIPDGTRSAIAGPRRRVTRGTACGKLG